MSLWHFFREGCRCFRVVSNWFLCLQGCATVRNHGRHPTWDMVLAYTEARDGCWTSFQDLSRCLVYYDVLCLLPRVKACQSAESWRTASILLLSSWSCWLCWLCLDGGLHGGKSDFFRVWGTSKSRNRWRQRGSQKLGAEIHGHDRSHFRQLNLVRINGNESEWTGLECTWYFLWCSNFIWHTLLQYFNLCYFHLFSDAWLLWAWSFSLRCVHAISPGGSSSAPSLVKEKARIQNLIESLILSPASWIAIKKKKNIKSSSRSLEINN